MYKDITLNALKGMKILLLQSIFNEELLENSSIWKVQS